jgi:hypothetical protein
MDFSSRHMNEAPPAPETTSGPQGAHRAGGEDAAVMTRVRAEFAEMRGFSPTLGQAARLFDLSQAECRRVLDSLVEDGVLQVTPEGCYRLAAGE